jgi:putative oxidoreductase
MILRVALAVLLLFHGVSILIGGVGFITGMLEKAGLPG